LKPNGTYPLNEQGKQVLIEYAAPSDVPTLMSEVIDYINEVSTQDLQPKQAVIPRQPLPNPR